MSGIAPLLAAIQSRAADLRPPLGALLDEHAGARAIGLWGCAEGELLLLAFSAPDLPSETARDFMAATRAVPLTRTEFGIVQAVVARKPMPNSAAPNPGANTSPGWIARFGARQSLAVPIQHASLIAGAIAVSTTAVLTPGDPRWIMVEQWAVQLSTVGPDLIARALQLRQPEQPADPAPSATGPR